MDKADQKVKSSNHISIRASTNFLHVRMYMETTT